MQTIGTPVAPLRSRSHSVAPLRDTRRLIERRLQRFNRRHASTILETAASHHRLADLALSFPALLHAVAVPRRGVVTDPVRQGVIDGVSLRELATLANIPYWTRRLPPEAFVGPIPPLPGGSAVALKIVCHIPVSPVACAGWLRTVSTMFVWGDADLAVWAADRRRTVALADEWRNVCLWKFFQTSPETELGRLIRQRWSRDMSAQSAISAAREWRGDARTWINLEEAQLDNVWASPATIDGIEFKPLKSGADIIAASRSFSNCSRSYAWRVACGRVRLWAARRGDEPVAMCELQPSRIDGVPRLSQVLGPANRDVSTEVWRAAHLWFLQYGTHQLAPPPVAADRRRAWLRAWRPYWISRRRIPDWLPLT